MVLKQALSIVLMALMVSGVVFGCLGTGKAEPITKPSVPNFTVTYVDNSYYMEPVYGVDQYSGKTIQTGGGYTVQNKSFELKIKNLPFTPYSVKDADGSDRQVGISYEIRYKGHYGENWKFYGVSGNSPSGYSVVLFGLDWGSWEPPVSLEELQAGDQVDFQVQAYKGYYDYTGPNVFYDREFVGETSGWSNIQTVAVPDDYSSPSIPEFPVIAVLPLLCIIPLMVAILQRKKKASI